LEGGKGKRNRGKTPDPFFFFGPGKCVHHRVRPGQETGCDQETGRQETGDRENGENRQADVEAPGGGTDLAALPLAPLFSLTPVSWCPHTDF